MWWAPCNETQVWQKPLWKQHSVHAVSTPLVKTRAEPLDVGTEHHCPASRGAHSVWGETCCSFVVPGINVYTQRERRQLFDALWEAGFPSALLVYLLSPVLAVLLVLNKYSLTKSPLNEILHPFYNSPFYCWTKWFVSSMKKFLVKWFHPDLETQSDTSAKSLFSRLFSKDTWEGEALVHQPFHRCGCLCAGFMGWMCLNVLTPHENCFVQD